MIAYECNESMIYIILWDKKMLLFYSKRLTRVGMEHFTFHQMKYLLHYANEKIFTNCFIKLVRKDLKEKKKKRLSLKQTESPTLRRKYITWTLVSRLTHALGLLH